jgi:hypothetical protein
MHLSLKGSLKSNLVLTYVKTDQALDLGNLEPFTIPDLSGNANTATLYSGIYVSTNGTTDKAIGANATALGSNNYYLSGKIKPAGTTAKTTMNGSTASNLTGLTAGVWQDFQTATASAITPSSINLGWDGTAFNATVDNWSEVKLHDASDDSVVAHWKLYDSADASLNGYPALDCVGGFHGTYTGCSSGSGEGVDADVAGISATLDDEMWFDETNDYVAFGNGADYSLTANQVFEFSFKTYYVSSANGNRRMFSAGTSTNKFEIYKDPTALATAFSFALGGTANLVGTGVLSDGAYEIAFGYDGSKLYCKVDGVEVDSSVTTYAAQTVTGAANVGARYDTILASLGVYYDVSFSKSGTVIFSTDGNGTADADWLDTSGNGNNGTVNGSPVTVGQKRETILQTAGEDFNKLIYAKATNVGVQLGASETLSGDFKIRANICIFSITADATIWGGATGTKIDIDTSLSSIEFRGPTSFQIALDSALLLKTPYEITITRTSGVVSVHVNGVEQSATATNSTNLNYQYFGYQFNRLNEGLNGLIWDCYQSDNADENWSHHWRLYGRNDTIDRIGANDGTATNSPPELLIPTSNTIPTNDALGNAIENPRPNERVLNLTTGTGYATVADSASLDLTTEATWELWGNFYGAVAVDEDLLVKYDTGDVAGSSFLIYKNDTSAIDALLIITVDTTARVTTISGLSDGLSQVVIIFNNGVITAYQNGVPLSIGGLAATELNVSDKTIKIGANEAAGTYSRFAKRQLGDIRIYDRALTADEVLKNYNARKSAYGL